jgi:uncharacterized protein DUF6508
MNDLAEPDQQDIDQLVAFLPKLYADGFVPLPEMQISEWEDGSISLPHARYDPLVEAFFHCASKECWCDHQYDPAATRALIEDPDYVADASLDQVRTMLTWCVRGERFCDGLWGSMVEDGTIKRLLERLREISKMSL